MKICLITKQKFYFHKSSLIASRLLWYGEDSILGFRFEEIEKMVLIGFNSEEKFDGYFFKKGLLNEIFIIGPKFREERRYILDRLINIFLTLKEIWKNRNILKDIDLVFASFFEYVVFEFLLLKLICKKAKFIVYVIGDYPEWNYRKKKNILFKWFLLIAQKISQKMADENWILSEYLMKKYKDKKSILVRTSTVSLKDIKSRKILNKEKISLIFVGRLEKEKNPDLPVLITAKLKEKGHNVYLNLVGDGNLRSEIEKIVNDLKLNEITKIFGWIREKDVLLEIIRNSDIFLFTSRPGEGLGLVIVEAMSQGLPVIATRCGGPEEIIENGINGYLIEYTNEKGIIDRFVEKIEYLIQNPEIYEQISKNNIEKAKEWTMEKFFKIQRERILKLLGKA